MSFMKGYAVGHSAGQNKAGVEVDVQSYYDGGVRDGRDIEHKSQKDLYINRLIHHLAARNSQKQALLRELRKYAPNHPYLNETVIVNEPSLLRDRIQRGELTYEDVANSNDMNTQARLLLLESGGGITTQGDLTMEAEGVAFTVGGASEDIKAHLYKIQDDLNISPSVRSERDKKARIEAKQAETERSRKEKAASGNWFAKVLGK